MNPRTRLGTIILLGLAVTGFLSAARAADDFPPLFPFLISYDGPDNASSMAHLVDAPAGKHGFLRVVDGRFVNDAGPVRLHATNLTGPANFPTHEQADKLAERLARFGINCVRLHYFDEAYGNFMIERIQGILANDPATQRNLDPQQVDRQDYLIAALKKRGIYVDLNLHVARWWDERDGFPSQDKRPGFDKGLDNFEPRMIELQKEYARKLLTRVNPYTGLAYTDDPCVAVIEVNSQTVPQPVRRQGPPVHAVVQGPLRPRHTGDDAWLGGGRCRRRLAFAGTASDHSRRSPMEDALLALYRQRRFAESSVSVDPLQAGCLRR